jgi:predicted TIM-barrel fold metal-dependent hydrolase
MDSDKTIKGSLQDFPPGRLLDADFRRGYARLARYGLSFDSWIFHPQIPELANLADKFSDTPVVLDHIGARSPSGRMPDDATTYLHTGSGT